MVDVLERHPAAIGAAVEATALAGPGAGRALSAHLARLVATTPMDRKEVVRLLAIVEGAGLGRVFVALCRLEVSAARATAEENPTTENRGFLAASLNNLGISLWRVGEYREALTVHRETVALRRKLATAEPVRYTADLGRTLTSLGASLHEVGEFRAALTTDREAVALWRELAAAEPARHTADLGSALNNCGLSLHAVGEYREALTTDREAVALWRELAAAEPAGHTADLASALNSLGGDLHEVGEYREALTVHARSPSHDGGSWPPPNRPATPPTSPAR